MRTKSKWTGRVQRWLPRLLALLWAKFAIQTAMSYDSGAPPQLESVDGLTPVPLWAIWSIPAVMTVLGVAIPPRASAKAQNVARWLRIGGMGIFGVFLIVWSGAFYLEPPRGWVTGKNYEMLFYMAVFCTWFIARDETGRKQVVRE